MLKVIIVRVMTLLQFKLVTKRFKETKWKKKSKTPTGDNLFVTKGGETSRECACLSDWGWELMKVCAWQAGSQSDVFPLQIFCKCQLSYYGAKLNMHTHTLSAVCESINSANYYSHHKYLLSYTLHLVSVRIQTTFQFCMMPSKSKQLLSYPLS